MLDNSEDERAAAPPKTTQRSARAQPGVVTFPRTDLRQLAEGIEYWKRTGRRFKGAAD